MLAVWAIRWALLYGVWGLCRTGCASGNSHSALSCTLGCWKCNDRAWGVRKHWAKSICVAALCFAALQVVLLCWENRLYDAMIYVYNSGMNDFISPMEVGEVFLQEGLLGCSAHILPEKQLFKSKALSFSLYSVFLLVSISRGKDMVMKSFCGKTPHWSLL